MSEISLRETIKERDGLTDDGVDSMLKAFKRGLQSKHPHALMKELFDLPNYYCDDPEVWAIIEAPPEKPVYAVKVQFNDHGSWSAKAYTYKVHAECKRGDILVVPVGKFYSVGRVWEFVREPTFRDDIKYRTVICKLDLPPTSDQF